MVSTRQGNFGLYSFGALLLTIGVVLSHPKFLDVHQGRQSEHQTIPVEPPVNIERSTAPLAPENNHVVFVQKDNPAQARTNEVEPQVFTLVEEMPSFPGGEAEMFKYLSKSIRYSEIAQDAGISGVVYMTFVVDEHGKVRDPKVLRGIGGGCDEEALRVVKGMPAWNPGRQKGEAVRVQYNLPVRFSQR